jgi:hypothetical protein
VLRQHPGQLLDPRLDIGGGTDERDRRHGLADPVVHGGGDAEPAASLPQVRRDAQEVALWSKLIKDNNIKTD